MRRLATRAVRAGLRTTYGRTLAYVPTRVDLPDVLNARGLLGTGYEVGVLDGEHSAQLLSRWRGRRLVSVDAWSVDCEEDPAAPRVTQGAHDEHLARARRRLAPFGERSRIVRAPSLHAAATVAPGSADFVYLDARHDYPSVSADIAAWLPAVRPGGLLAGHDYYDGDRFGQDYGVRRAVDELCARRGWRLALTRRDHPEQSWLVVVS